jgi:hypothetical protein
MRLVGAWITVVVVAAALATSCSINHRSSDYACTQQSDCEAGRTCVGGFCVDDGLPKDARTGVDATTPVDARPVVDAQPDAPVQPVCPSQCTSCNFAMHECRIDCTQTNCVTQAVVCPPGWNCDIACSTQGACDEGIDCRVHRSGLVPRPGVRQRRLRRQLPRAQLVPPHGLRHRRLRRPLPGRRLVSRRRLQRRVRVRRAVRLRRRVRAGDLQRVHVPRPRRTWLLLAAAGLRHLPVTGPTRTA